jgi:hypothetical protein
MIEWIGAFWKVSSSRWAFKVHECNGVMECVIIVSYSIRFNNVLLEPFKPLCGLHQGDPLLPYLFLFMLDGLSKLSQKKFSEAIYTSSIHAEELQTSPISYLRMTHYSS